MELKNKQCKPCEGGVAPMSEAEEEQYVQSVPSWSLNRDGTHRISKDFKFKTFPQAIQFVNKVAEIAENQGHHPNFCVNYTVVKTELYTHAIDGLSENDFIMAAKLDNIV